MAKIFISHSSRDKVFARKLSKDLTALNHDPWLDEWEIKVGECIVSKIEHGITECDYIVIVLSQSSVSSGWVEKEWKTKYWDEVNQGKTLVLPVLIEDCDIPTLLKTKKYADFRSNYSIALVELMGSISPTISMSENPRELIVQAHNHDVTDLITKFQTRTTPLSQCIAETYSWARKCNMSEIETMCVGELSGWYDDKREIYNPRYRIAQVYLSVGSQINMQYFGWGGEASNILNYMKNNPSEFTPSKLLFPHPIAKLESDADLASSNKLISITMKAKDFVSNFSDPNTPVYVYTDSNTFRTIIETIRAEFTAKLMKL